MIILFNLVLPLLVILVSVFTNANGELTVQSWQPKLLILDKPDAILALQEITIVQMKLAWNYTHTTHALKATNGTGSGLMRTFWLNMKLALGVIYDQLLNMDKKIIEAQPSILLNQLFGLQDLDILMELADSLTTDPFVLWKVKWIEISSLATHIHWLFNKRIRDIMNNVPYIKTIANSIAKYYGNPYYSKMSGRANSTHRYAQRNFPRWIDDILYSVPEGDLFFGLRQMLNNCTSCSMGSATPRETCIKTRKVGKVLAVRLDAPLYIFFYTCLVDIKFYILKSFFHIYRELYENSPYANYAIFDDRLRSRMQKKYDSFMASFNGYDAQSKLGKKILPGYFRCDPPAINTTSSIRNHILNQTYITLTNIGSYFITSEKDMLPSGNCSSSCQQLAPMDRVPCALSDQECQAQAYSECASNPKLCETFKPTCPLQDTYCIYSGMTAKICPSQTPGQLFNWIKLNGNETYPVDSSSCSETEVAYEGTLHPITQEKCEVCLCSCMEPIAIAGSSEEDSVRFFSQNEAMSLLIENRVIVGFKFEQIENQIHIMIADAVSIPKYKVDTSTLKWRQPNKAKNPEEVMRISRRLRAFHLDSWRAPEGYVITGISLVLSQQFNESIISDLQPYITVKLKVTKVNPETGKLEVEDSKEIMNPINANGMKAAYKYTAPGNPLLADGPALPDNGANQLISFRTTSILKTAENLVIPFLDAQEVTLAPNTDSALTAVGIYHKRRAGSGGFLGIKVLPYSERKTDK